MRSASIGPVLRLIVMALHPVSLILIAPQGSVVVTVTAPVLPLLPVLHAKTPLPNLSWSDNVGKAIRTGYVQ